VTLWASTYDDECYDLRMLIGEVLLHVLMNVRSVLRSSLVKVLAKIGMRRVNTKMEFFRSMLHGRRPEWN
jgi:hypothetical protein